MAQFSTTRSPGGHVWNTRAALEDDSGSLMPHNQLSAPGHRVEVRVAHAAGAYLDENLAWSGVVQHNFGDEEVAKTLRQDRLCSSAHKVLL